MSTEARDRIEGLIKKNRVVLFMKGNKHFPQCGFSAQVVKILGDAGVPYDTVNVLSDPVIRDGIKAYSDWPTIPQLYVDGNFVGGCDIVKDMNAQGELQKLLGVNDAVAAPAITITDTAKKAFSDADDGSGDKLRLEVSSSFQYDLSFGPPEAGDITVIANGITVLVDRASARRANGIKIDWVNAPVGLEADGGGGAFKIENPNEPASVKKTSASEVKKWLDAGETLELIDVRGENERVIAKIAQAKMLDEAYDAKLKAMPKDTRMVFQCHHGTRSRRAAEAFLAEGFTHVFNLEGGIDAWSTIDPTVPRY